MKRIRLTTLPSPYVGLRPFFEAEALLFFGRDAHVAELLAKLQRQQRFLAVLGASGTGKSSLVRAGLIPALRRGALATAAGDAPAAGATATAIDRWNTCIFTPGDAPLARLAQALADDERWCEGSDRALAESALAAQLGASPLALTTLYRQKAARFEREALLLVVDQFEEIFRYRQRNPDEADSFVKLLLRSASEEVPIYVVMTMRSDFLGNAVAIHGLAEAINSGIYLTPRLGPEQIRSVISSPLQLVGGDIDPVLANRLVNTLGGEDELPVLEHALLRMWDRAKAHGRSSLEAEDYAAICGPRQGAGAPALPLAIDNHASEIYDALTPPQQAVARLCFLALVERREGRDVRRPQTLAELRALVGQGDADAQAAWTAVLDAYRAPGVGFVLPPANKPLHDAELVDISHESLIRRWRQLQEWLAAEALDVTELREWKQRAERRAGGGGWLDDNDAARAANWRERVQERGQPTAWAARHAGPGAYERVEQYLQASQAELDRGLVEREALRSAAEEARVQRFAVEAQMQRAAAERAAADKASAEQQMAQAQATTRKIRFRGRIALAVGFVALVACGLAWDYKLKADKARDQAAAEARRAWALATKARAGELAHTAEALGRELPDTSVLLALQARRLDPDSALANALIRAAEAAYPYRLVLHGHRARVVSALFSPDGNTVLTASRDHTARLWNAADGKPLGVFNGHEAALTSARFSSDGKTVLTTSEDGTARLWDAAGTTHSRTLGGLYEPVLAADFSHDGQTVATAGKDGGVRLWNTTDGTLRRRLTGHQGAVTSVRFSPDGKTLLSGSEDLSARLWDVASGRLLREFRGYHQYAIAATQFSSDGKRILTASWDGTTLLWDIGSGSRPLHVLQGRTAQFSPDDATVLTSGTDGRARVWSTATGKELLALKGHEGPLGSAVFSRDGKAVLTTGADKTVRLWDLESGEEQRTLAGHEDGVVSGVFSRDGKTLLTASDDGTARLWDMAGSALLHTLQGHEEALRGVEFAPHGKAVVTASADKTARLWAVADGRPLGLLQGHTGPVTDAVFSPDGASVLTASMDATGKLWHAASAQLLRTLHGHSSAVNGARFSADGKTALTSSDDNSAKLWDVASGREQLKLAGHNDAVSSARYVEAGRRVLTASFDNTVRLWDAASGQLLRGFEGDGNPVAAARIASTGNTLLSASWGSTARLWNVADGKLLLTLGGHTDQLNDAGFSPNGSLALTASDDRSARLWEVAGGRYLRTLTGHEGPVTTVLFSADGHTVLSTSNDATARLWDVASGKLLRTLRGHEDTVVSARFSPDGMTVVTASEDKTARLWRCSECRPVQELADQAVKRIGRSLSAEERQRYGVPEARQARE